MTTFADRSSSREPDPDLLFRIDAWAGEVLVLRADALGIGEDPFRGRRRLDDVFGTYIARDRLSRVAGAEDLLVVQAIDALFVSCTEEVGRSWLALTGMPGDAGSGWWWGRLPVAGPARDDFDTAVRPQRDLGQQEGRSDV